MNASDFVFALEDKEVSSSYLCRYHPTTPQQHAASFTRSPPATSPREDVREGHCAWRIRRVVTLVVTVVAEYLGTLGLKEGG